jgi:hypothetical protein
MQGSTGVRARHRMIERVLWLLGGGLMSGCTLLSGVSDDSLADDPVAKVRTAPTAPSESSSSPTATNGSQPTETAPADANESAPVTDADAAAAPEAPKPTKLVFVMDLSGQASVGGPEGADGICQQAASYAGLGQKEWRAWLSTATASAITRIQHDGPYALVNGTLVAAAKSELSSGKLRHAIDTTEHNRQLGLNEALVWTGTAGDGTASSGDRCREWTLAADSFATVGSALSADVGWTASSARSCEGLARMYCFEL